MLAAAGGTRRPVRDTKRMKEPSMNDPRPRHPAPADGVPDGTDSSQHCVEGRVTVTAAGDRVASAPDADLGPSGGGDGREPRSQAERQATAEQISQGGAHGVSNTAPAPPGRTKRAVGEAPKQKA